MLSAHKVDSMTRALKHLFAATLVAGLALTLDSVAVAAAGPTLIGTQTIGANHDSNPAGSAEAFKTTATASGTIGTISVYLDAANTAGKVTVGIYTDALGHPGTLLASGSAASPLAGAWNDISVPSASLSAGLAYWIAVLGPSSSSGTVQFRDAPAGGNSQSSAEANLDALPSTWSQGNNYNNAPISAYATGTAATTPLLTVSPTSLSFGAQAGSSDPAPAQLNVSNSGAGQLSFTAATDQPWLHVAPTSGSAPQTLTVSASVSGLAAGTYTANVTVTSPGTQGSPATVPVSLTVTAPSPPSSGDWLTIEHDAARSGYNPDETAIGTANVNSLSQSWATTLDGKITASPLYVTGFLVNGATHDVVVEATSQNSLYAVDATNGTVLWKRNFGGQATNCAVPGGFGISASPVIDRASGRVYTVSDDGQLHTISLADGSDAAPALAVVENPTTNKVWGGLNFVNGALYIASASDGCDTYPWRGGVYRVDLSTGTPRVSGHFATVPSIPAPAGGGGIWGYGGVAADTSNGHIYAASGADSNEQYIPYGDRAIALDAGLNVLGTFAPLEPTTFPCTGAPCDMDFGATPTVYNPTGCPTMAAVGNKNGNLYVFKVSGLEASGAPLRFNTQHLPRRSRLRRCRRRTGLLARRPDAVRQRRGTRNQRNSSGRRRSDGAIRLHAQGRMESATRRHRHRPLRAAELYAHRRQRRGLR